MRRVHKALWRVLTSWPFIFLTLLLCSQGSLSLTLGNTVWGAVYSLFMPATVFSILITSIIARSDPKGWKTAVSMFLLGILVIYIRIGNLGKPFWAILQTLPGISLGLFNWIRHQVSPDFSAFLLHLNDLLTHGAILTIRLASWFRDLLTGTENQDSVAQASVWTFVVWILSALAAWSVFQRKKLLLGLLPTTGILAYIIYYTGLKNGLLLLNVCAVLLLLGLAHYYDRWQRWITNKFDYYEYISMETSIAIILTSFILIAAAAYIPSVSIQEIVDFFRELNRARNEQVTETLGLEADPDAQRIQVEYFQPEETKVPIHHLGAGPDLGNEVLFTVHTGDLHPMPPEMITSSASPPRYYWRINTFDHYNGSGWISTLVKYQDLPAETLLFEVPYPQYRTVHQEVLYQQEMNGQLVWTGTLAKIDQPFELGWRTGGPYHNNFLENTPVSISELFAGRIQVDRYQAVSVLPEANTERLLNSTSPYPEWIEKRYLQLPEELPERVYTLARNLTSTAPTPYERAVAIESYLREIPYSLDVPVPPQDQDVVSFFLFEQKEGFCDYYATSMVVLARASGLPARFVTGYASGNYDYLNARYIIQASHAHSWVEIYFSGIGWVQFEPTASQPIISRDNLELPVIPTPSAPVDAFEQTQEPLAEKVAHWMATWVDLAPFAVVFILAVLLLGLQFERFLMLRFSPQRLINRTFRRVYRHGRRITGPPEKAQTPLEFVDILTNKLNLRAREPFLKLLSPAAAELEEIARVYIQYTYSDHPIRREDVSKVLRLWQALRWRVLLATIILPPGKTDI